MVTGPMEKEIQGGSPHPPFDSVNGFDFYCTAGTVTGPT